MPAIRTEDVGRCITVTDDQIELTSWSAGGKSSGVVAARRRLVDWGVSQPGNLQRAKILSVEERIGGVIEVTDALKGTLRFSTPVGGLVNDVLGYMT